MKIDINTLKQHKTPFFWYDVELLEQTLEIVKNESEKYGYNVHYAVKANANEPILRKIAEYGLGADCVSGNEVLASINVGFPPNKIAFAELENLMMKLLQD
jgi:diaminopimelate decarboxylase